MKKLRVDVVSDFVCPWCIIGYKKLEKALDILGEQVEAEIVWHASILKPNLPTTGQNQREHVIEQNKIDDKQVDANRAELIEVGKQFGFDFNFHDEFKTYNTTKVHELIHLANEQGKQKELTIRFFYAYYNENKDIGNPDVLVAEAVKVGLDKATCESVLADSRYAEAVVTEAKTWKEKNVTNIPTYFVNDIHRIEESSESAEEFAKKLLNYAE